MNDAEIDRIVGELRGSIGAPLSNLWQPSRDRVVVGLGDGTLILIVPRGPFARVHAVRSRPANPPRPFSFQGACRAHLHGALLDVRRSDDDRIVRIAFTRGALEVRLTGRSGGLWLLDGDQVVAAFDGPALPVLPPISSRGSHRDEPPRFAPTGSQRWNEAAEQFFSAAERDKERRERQVRVESGLTRALGRNDRLLGNLEEDLAKADEAPTLRHHADLLAANLYRVQRFDRVLVAEDWETGETVNIALDPARTPGANLERLYHQAKRLERMADHVLARIEQVEGDQRWMRAALPTVASLGLDELIALDARLPKAPTPGRAERSDRPAPGYITWVGPNGQRILVGRNARGNRALTFQVAKGHDWWLHLRERPGAHVVIPTPKDHPPPLELLLAAAQLSLQAGKIGPGEAAEVQYTRVRDVRAIPGEEGRVTVRDEKVLRVVRDPAALTGWTPLDLP